MSKMIPPSIHQSIQSNAERKIFNLFKNAEGTEDWIVLHSLALTSVTNKLYGEIDFVVLIPNKGIFVLEVKGGRISKQDGVWLFKNRFGEINKKIEGPFEQAKKAAYALIGEIKTRRHHEFKHLDHVLFNFGVMFPDIKFNVDSVEHHNWQVFDASTQSITHYMDRLFHETVKKWNRTYDTKAKHKVPNSEDVKHIVNLIRPDFDQKIAVDNQINEIENKLIQLTEEQYLRLTEIEDNPRLVIKGTAGTGKTLLAIEAAKRFKSENLKVAFFCYNRNLAEWIEDYFDKKEPSLKPDLISTLYSKMIKDLKSAGKINDGYNTNKLFQDPTFYNQILPSLVSQVNVFNENYDVLIIDEAQDLLFDGVIKYLDKILINNLIDGKWYFFGDFSNQTIYKDTNLDEIYDRLDQVAYYSKLTLSINCRNTIEIYNAFKMYSQLKMNDKVLGVQGLPVEFIYYEFYKDNLSKLSERLSKLLKDDVKPSKITILSPYKYENSIASKLSSRISKDLSSDSAIKFSTVYAYKGLENSVIILTDITKTIDSKLLYVGMSRAKSSLIIIASKELKEVFESRAKEYIYHDGFKTRIS